MTKSKGGSQRRRQESFEALARAVQCIGAGDYPKAAALAETAIRLDGANWEALKLRGLIAVKNGEPDAAVQYFESVLKCRHDDDTVLILGESCWRAGLFAQAIDALESYLRTHPGHAQASFQLGIARERAGQHAEAEAAFGAAVQAVPDWAAAWNNLGQMQQLQGKFAAAEQSWRTALGLSPSSAAVLYNLASCCAGDPERRGEAIRFLELGLGIEPSARRCLELASLLHQGGETEKSLAYYQQALELDPQFSEAYNSLGCVYFENGIHAEAERLFRTAVAFAPERADFLVNLGVALNALGRYDEAEAVLRHAVALNPEDAKAHNFLAIVLAARGLPHEAMTAGRRAIAIDPGYQDALVQLAALEGDAGQTGLALDHYRQANAVKRNDAIRLLCATMLPPIMGTIEEIGASRRRVMAELDALQDDPTLHCSLDDLKLVTEAGFYFAFHGMNDRDLLSMLSRVLRRLCPELNWTSPHLHNPRPVGARLRIGFASSFFFSHSVGICFGPVIKALAQRGDMEIFLIGIGQSEVMNPMQLELIDACQYFVPVADTSLASARETIASLQLDILCYADIGMRTFSNLLAHARLAPAQCVLAGHPDTTGIDTVDYFMRMVPARIANAQEQYSERLIAIKNGGTILWRQDPVDVRRSREELGLPATGRLYVCPMKLQKIHPDFDAALRGILAADEAAQIILFQDVTHREWHELVRARMSLGLSAEQLARVHFLPWISRMADFIAVNACADAVLDSFPFGAGSTAIILMQMGVPMVSFPGAFARGQMGSEIYDQLGITDLIADSVEQYVAMAVRLASDKGFRADIAQRLIDGYPAISGPDEVVADLVAAFAEIAGRRPAVA